ELGFQNGDVVKPGQMLYRLDSVKYEAAVKNAEAKIAEYKARCAYAESSYKRNKHLAASNAVSTDALESSLSLRNANQATLIAAEADLVAAKDDLADCRIVAPIGGKIGTTNFTRGNYVTPSSGTLVTLIQTSPIRVGFSISNKDYLTMFGGRSKNICANGIVKLTLADGKEHPESGTVEYVENAANESTDTIQIFALFPNRNRILKPRSTLGVTLQSKIGTPSAAIPPSAVAQDIKGAFVWLLGKDNRVRKQYIERGAANKDLLMVRSGLKVGETVVSDGIHKVSEGDRIVPVTEKR
ncbi:MAG: efflux RND transporter periplasmic adaptor subunit, partial [Victivallaceae bacterium]|nr:efflux RND transporter periplasmic adaptor subunit [Victivallaceae bacterium]